jgi:hypothetical protein
MSRPRQSPLQRDLAKLAADYRLGALVNEVDAIAKRHAVDPLPAATRKAAASVWAMLADLDLTDAASARGADVWRSS